MNTHVKSLHVDRDSAGLVDRDREGRLRAPLVSDLANERKLRELRAPLSLRLSGLQIKPGTVRRAGDAPARDLSLEEGSLTDEADAHVSALVGQRANLVTDGSEEDLMASAAIQDGRVS